MRSLKNNRIIINSLGILSFFFLPLSSQALCLNECQQAPNAGINAPQINVQKQQTEIRNQSHNFGDNSTNVLGDVKIHIGHDHVEIKGMEHSTNSVIDNSVNSTVILGNVK